MNRPNYTFFSHRTCECFPCHPNLDGNTFNCLFCYCPLYVLGKSCGGRYVYTAEGIKDCSCCDLPHKPDGYTVILERLPMVIDFVRPEKGSV